MFVLLINCYIIIFLFDDTRLIICLLMKSVIMFIFTMSNYGTL